MLENIRIVLVRPRGSGNIGAVARSMKNTGLRDLAIVGKGRTQSFWARAMAVHAKELLKETRRFDTLREAVADCGLVMGTTCRGGLYRSHSRPLRDVAPKMVAAADGNSPPVALVFGPEDHGLDRRDLRYCQGLITIPTHPDYPSLNMAQAVMVCLYELFLASMESVSHEALHRARAENVERLFDKMRSSLLKIGFLDSHNPDHILLALRRILGRAGLEEKDVRILMGLFRQVEWYAEGGWKVAEEKKGKESKYANLRRYRSMGLNDMELEKTAILYFDTLKGYWYTPEGAIKPAIRPMADNSIRLMKAARAARIPIFFAKGNHRPDGASSATIITDTTMGLQPWPDGIITKNKPSIMAGHSSSEIPSELDPRPEDYYIPKYRWSAFYQTCLDLSLRARGIDTIIISGGSTEVGVASTVYSGRDADYNMVIVRDACTTSHDQRALDALMDLVFPRMARVRTTDQVLNMIREAK